MFHCSVPFDDDSEADGGHLISTRTMMRAGRKNKERKMRVTTLEQEERTSFWG